MSITEKKANDSREGNVRIYQMDVDAQVVAESSK